MADKTLDTLFHDTLKDIYYAERKILKSLPKMARAAQSPELKAAFEEHKGQTEGQIERLQQVFELIGKPARIVGYGQQTVGVPASTRRQATTTVDGARSGSTTRRNRCQGVAPSISQTSSRSPGMAVSPAR